MPKFWNHFKTITHHRHLVMRGCFKLGLIRQGLLHDLSKYSYTEFSAGAKYWSGKESPNNAQRKTEGVSYSWLHHKGRNKHHLEYWTDYSPGSKEPFTGMKMPIKYVVEMFVDRVSACKNYQKDAYEDKSALEYYKRGLSHTVIHPDTHRLLLGMLTMLSERGEKETYRYIKKNILTRKGSEYGEGYEDLI